MRCATRKECLRREVACPRAGVRGALGRRHGRAARRGGANDRMGRRARPQARPRPALVLSSLTLHSSRPLPRPTAATSPARVATSRPMSGGLFRKFSLEDVSTQNNVKSSVQRAIRGQGRGQRRAAARRGRMRCFLESRKRPPHRGPDAQVHSGSVLLDISGVCGDRRTVGRPWRRPGRRTRRKRTRPLA